MNNFSHKMTPPGVVQKPAGAEGVELCASNRMTAGRAPLPKQRPLNFGAHFQATNYQFVPIRSKKVDCPHRNGTAQGDRIHTGRSQW